MARERRPLLWPQPLTGVPALSLVVVSRGLGLVTQPLAYKLAPMSAAAQRLSHPRSAVGKGVPIKTSRGRSRPIKCVAFFPLWDFGEVTEEVSGIRGPWKEVPRQSGVLLSGPGLPNCLQTTGVLEVPPFSKYGPLLGPRAFPGGSMVKKKKSCSPVQRLRRRELNPWVGRIPWRRRW